MGNDRIWPDRLFMDLKLQVDSKDELANDWNQIGTKSIGANVPCADLGNMRPL
jgi:hypothetical protein